MLFVLGACRSTQFARETWDQLMTSCQSSEDQSKLAALVGFVTSADESSVTTAIIISKEDELVYLFDPAPPKQADDYALGYRIRNSMFGRRLSHLWTYVLEPDPGLHVRHLPGLLNSECKFHNPDGSLKDPTDDGAFYHGFRSEFVGASAGFPAMLGDRELNDFLPLKPVKPSDLLPGREDVTFGEVIPSQAIDGVFDDLTCYREVGFTASSFEGMCVEIKSGQNGIEVVQPAPRLIKDLFPPGHPIAESLDIGGLPATEGGDTDEGAPHVSWLQVSRAILALAESQRWYQRFTDETPQRFFEDAARLLESLDNGPAPCSWPFVGYLALFARLNEDNTAEFEKLIQNEYRKLRAGLPARPPSPPGDGR
jgi:hypothetical protein